MTFCSSFHIDVYLDDRFCRVQHLERGLGLCEHEWGIGAAVAHHTFHMRFSRCTHVMLRPPTISKLSPAPHQQIPHLNLRQYWK